MPRAVSDNFCPPGQHEYVPGNALFARAVANVLVMAQTVLTTDR